MALNECSIRRAGEWVKPTRSWGASAHAKKREGEIHTLRRMYGYRHEHHGPRLFVLRKKAAGNSLDQLFEALAEQWRDETAHLSSIPKVVMHPAYQRIVGMGRAALPLILRSMREQPGYWFWALEMIAGENPVPAEDAGHTKKMKEAWLSWGAKRGLI